MRRAWRTRGLRISASLVSVLALALAMAVPSLARSQGEDPASEPLSGAFAVTMAGEDIPAGLADGASLLGRWLLTLEDGAFTLARQDIGEIVSGAYDAGPAALAFTEWNGIIECDSDDRGSAPARYAWQLENDHLALTPLEDSCIERLVLLTTRPLARAGTCAPLAPVAHDPFTDPTAGGTPVAVPTLASGVAAQEGFGEGADVDEAIDRLLETAGGCWALADPDRFMMLHSENLRGQIAMMGPPEAFTQELQSFMETPLRFSRIGDVQMVDPNHAWAYVEVELDGLPNPQRVNFALENGVWLFDSFALFGPPLAGPAALAP